MACKTDAESRENIHTCVADDQFELLFLNHETKEAIYLGYDMGLTASEFRLLFALYESKRTCTAEELLALLSCKKPLARGNVAVHVCNINKKARWIGGRNLILGEDHQGYRLTEHL